MDLAVASAEVFSISYFRIDVLQADLIILSILRIIRNLFTWFTR